MRVRFSLVALAALFLAQLLVFSNAQQAQVAAPSAPAPDTQVFRSALETVSKGKEAAQRAWELLRASATSGGAATESDFAADWLRTVTPNGPAPSKFYAETENLLNAWISAVSSGEDLYPPTDDIPAAMDKWQETQANILDSFQQTATLEKTLRAQAARLAKMKPESPEWLFYKDQQQQQQITLKKLLTDAGSDLNSPAAIPAPIMDADRTASPFNGPVTPGSPDRLWLHLRKASASIGESIKVQVGLANSRGPNVAANQNYAVALGCEGCTAKSSEITIRQSERYTQTEIRVTGATLRLTANSAGFRPVQANAFGCYRGSSVSLAAEQDRSTGPADGETPIPFRFAFHDANGQRATDGRRKSIAPRLTGVGERILLQPSFASVLARDGSITVPAGECVSGQGVVSSLVGNAKVSAEYKGQQVGPLEFHFLYAFPLIDKFCIALGVLFGFIANYFVMKHRQLHWLASVFSSAVGATIVFGLGYAYVLNGTTTPDTWVIAIGLATIGGVLGVSAAKLVLAKFGPSSDSQDHASTPGE